jgi:hypothetical protein
MGTTAGPALTLGRVSGSPNIKADSGASGWFIADSNGGNAALNYFVTDNVILAQGGGNVGIGTTSPASKLQVNGTILPGANGTQNLGSSSLRWNTVYTSDLSLKNDVGDWTIVEGEEDLFLYNNKKDKVYKFNLTEVDKDSAPKKRS